MTQDEKLDMILERLDARQPEEYLNMLQAAETLNISIRQLYNIVATDPTFPAVPMGDRKKIVPRRKLEAWVERRAQLHGNPYMS